MRGAFSLVALLMLAGCTGHVKGIDAGVGFDAFNTQSKESKENEKWFDSFYGRGKCNSLWVTGCDEDAPSGGGGGGMWTGGVGPSDP
jgi:hypothetical protein